MEPIVYKEKAYKHKKTKELVKYIPPHSIAVIEHQDIDVTAAESLIVCNVVAVINYKKSMTGMYDHNGVARLLEANIPVFDIVDIFFEPSYGDDVLCTVRDNGLYILQEGNWKKAANLEAYSFGRVFELKRMAFEYFPKQFLNFVDNSLSYAKKEAASYAKGIHVSPALTKCRGKNVLIVGRGEKYQEDVQATYSWIKKTKPFIIAVDGGADALVKLKISPNVILGDMDSVTDEALCCGATLVAHCYADGHSPGKERLEILGLQAETISFPGTSEDIAILLPFWAGASKTFIIGSHTSMVDFLDKGRLGMGSSLLTRMQTGHQLVDLRGIHLLKKGLQQRYDLFRLSLIPASASMILLFLFQERVKIIVEILLYSILGGG